MKRVKQEPPERAGAVAATPLLPQRDIKRQRKQPAPQYCNENDENDAAASNEAANRDAMRGVSMDQHRKQQAAHKVHDGGEDDDDDDEEEEDEQQQQQQQHQQQEEEDGDDEHMADEDDKDEQGATQAYIATQHDSKRITVRRKGLAGHLHSIKLQNFMCHENFEMTFGTHVNFVSGTNGSGKSAVLQGLQCCLGATAKSTGRAPSLEQFIRTGADEAKAQVTLWNTGEDAYHGSLFGETVTIERRFARKGGSAWKVYDSRMRPVASASNRSSINAMLDHFSINAANPLAVMTQDTSRNFLCGGTADKKKFELFMEATMLSNFKHALSTASMHVQKMNAGTEEVRKEYREVEARLKQVQERLKKLKESDQLLTQRSHIENALGWAVVAERTAVLADMNAKLAVNGPAARQPYEKELVKLEAQLERLRDEEKAKTDRQLEINQANQEFAAVMQQLHDDVRNARKVLVAVKRKRQEHAQQVAHTQSHLDSYVKAQMESNDDSKRELAQRLAHNQSQMAQESQRRDALAQEVATRQEELAQAQQRVHDLETQRPGLVHKLESTMRTIENYRREKLNCAAASKDAVQAFGGAAMSHLRAAVQSNLKHFNRPPLGPLGAHLALDDSKWAFAVEAALVQHLNKWIVHNQQDERQLRELARRCNCSHYLTVLVYNFDTPKYVVAPAQRPRGQYTLLQDVVRLKVDRPELEQVLWNQLLDRANAANVVLAENDKAADAGYSHDFNISAAFDLQGTKYQSIGQGRNTTRVTAFQGRPRLGVDTGAAMRELDGLIADAQAKLQEMQQSLSALDAELHAARTAVTNIQNTIRGAARNKAQSDASLRMLGTQAQEIAAEQAEGQDQDMAGVIAGLQQDLTTCQMQLDQVEGELQEATQAEARMLALHQQKQDEIAMVSDELSSINDAVEQIAEQRGRAQDAVRQLKHALAQLGQQEERLRQQRETEAASVERYRAEAAQQCSEEDGQAALEAVRAWMLQQLADHTHKRLERQCRAGAGDKRGADAELLAELASMSAEERHDRLVAEVVERTRPEGLLKEHERMEKAIQSAEGEAGGSKEDLEVEEAKLEAEVLSRRAVVVNLVATTKRMTAFWHERNKAYGELFDNVKEGVAHKFSKYMKQRNHLGRIEVEEETGELRLKVKINAANAPSGKSQAVKDLKQLSGGERSYTTVAFILALGEWTESPFRAMDEFDVFMDAINRRIATGTLLKFAIDNDHLQFVLLTPQDLQAVEDAKKFLAVSEKKDIPAEFVKVVQMRPARENATHG